MAGVLAGLLALFGCSSHIDQATAEQRAATLRSLASQVDGATVVDSSYTLVGGMQVPTASIDFRTDSTDPVEIRRILTAGFRATLAVSDSDDPGGLAVVTVTDATGTKHDGTEIGLSVTMPAMREVREKLG